MDWTLKLDTVQFSAYLITKCSNVQVIWWHTPVIACVSAVVLWHKMQQEPGKHHWFPYSSCSSQHRRTSLSFCFLFILLVHLSFMKKKPSSFFCTALNKSLWICVHDSSEGGQCAMWSWWHRHRDHTTGIDMEKQRPRTEVTVWCPLTRSKLSLTVLKTQTLFLWGHQKQKGLRGKWEAAAAADREPVYLGRILQGHPQLMAGTPTYFLVLFIHLNHMETMDL